MNNLIEFNDNVKDNKNVFKAKEQKIDYTVVKHNSLINIKSKEPYTVNQIKLICHLISHIKPTDTNFETKEVPIISLGFSSIESKNYDVVKDFIRLLEMPFRLPGDWGFVNWFSYMKYKDGIIEYAFDERLKPYLLELKDNFTSYQLSNVLNLQGKYAIQLYELLAQYKVIGSRVIDIQELRELLHFPCTYENKTIIMLIKDAQEHIKNKTDINFTFKQIKKVRTIVSLDFAISQKKLPKNNKDLEKTNQLTIDSSSGLINNIRSLKIERSD